MSVDACPSAVASRGSHHDGTINFMDWTPTVAMKSTLTQTSEQGSKKQPQKNPSILGNAKAGEWGTVPSERHEL